VSLSDAALVCGSLQGDWSNLTGNIPKLILALESMAFDVLFMFQHYVLYRHSRGDAESSTSRDRGLSDSMGPSDGASGAPHSLQVPYAPVPEGNCDAWFVCAVHVWFSRSHLCAVLQTPE